MAGGADRSNDGLATGLKKNCVTPSKTAEIGQMVFKVENRRRWAYGETGDGGVRQSPARLGCRDVARIPVLRLQADAIVDCILEPLLAANVSLGGLNALVTEEELDLLDIAARVVAQARASAPQIMGSDTGQTALTAGGRDH
jgi:hypothetical protein